MLSRQRPFASCPGSNPSAAVLAAVTVAAALAATFAFGSQARAQCAGWSCNPSYYAALDGCDCECGCYDPDCDDPAQALYGCAAGEACVPPGVCAAGVPTCAGWTCDPTYYDADDGCDCECGCWDPDCADPGANVYGCATGETCVLPGVCSGGGSGGACAGWTCNSTYYDAGDGCDCGCGCWDPDCSDPTALVYGCAEGEACIAPGVCAGGGGGGTCAGWICDSTYYDADDGCDCNCGCWDPDCGDPGATVYGCDDGQTCVTPGVCSDGGSSGGTCAGWTCSASYFDAGDGCDCGCGCWDPDCGDPGATLYGCAAGEICVQPGVCSGAGPGGACAGWSCDPTYYAADDGCDCGCGCWDPDCDDPTALVYGCAEGEACTPPGLCGGATPTACAGWTCNAAWWDADDGCDCGCGCWDPDCADPAQPIYGCDDGVACVAPGVCEGGGPGPGPGPCAGWVCDETYYDADDGCDCGCGCWDPDCADPTARVYGCAAGDACVQPGVCAGGSTPTVCSGWSCPPSYYGTDDGCDCDCGCWDPDCDDPTASVYGCESGQRCVPPGTCGGGGAACAGWTCDPSYYAAVDGCDCGCGCWDPDCDDPSAQLYGCAPGQGCVAPGVCDGGSAGPCAGWSCEASWYAADDGCDCGCGCWDPDCADPTQEVFGCTAGEACVQPGVCDDSGPVGPGACLGWRCQASYYDAGDGCDCDCGCWDPDCDDPSQGLYGCAGGEVCVQPGVCSGSCTPQCAGRECGSDGCGGVCGQCAPGASCNASGRCVQGCTPSCTGRECGSDGCGGSCGTCPAGRACGANGRCESCTPNCAGRACGSDGCGGTCGSCDHGETCTAAGVCQAGCVPSCTGRECGDNGCGGTCGTCRAGEHCTAAGQCEGACVPDCRNRECGSNGCGGSCGQCPSGWTCSAAGRCQSDCTPDCRGKECGNDGCGGSCGACGLGTTCSAAGRCVDVACSPSCGGRQCGEDGCGGSCGTCPRGTTCSATGMCVEEGCEPACDGKQCGEDGCGGLCGTCPDHAVCDIDGICVFGGCVRHCEGRECGDDGCGGSCGECGSGTTCSSAGLCTFALIDASGGSDVARGDTDGPGSMSSGSGGCAAAPAAGGPAGVGAALLLLLLLGAALRRRRRAARVR
jgi:hypothetical protein